MSKLVVYKYELRPLGDFPVQIHAGWKLLSIQSQKNRPILWALVDPDRPVESFWFRIVLTGENRKAEDFGQDYLATFQLYDGDYVAHVFLKQT